MAKSCKIPSSRGTLTNAQWINAQREAIRICERRKIPMHLVCSSCKKPQVVECRDEIIRVLDGWGWSTPQIGAVLSKNHSSIVIARQRMGIRAGYRRPGTVHWGSDRTSGRAEVKGSPDAKAERLDAIVGGGGSRQPVSGCRIDSAPRSQSKQPRARQDGRGSITGQADVYGSPE